MINKMYLQNINFVKNILIIFVIFFTFSKSYAIENKILLKINNEIVTTVDLLHEIKYLSILNKNLNKLENQKVFDIARNSLIREKIKEIELIKVFKKLTIDDEYYNQILLQNAKKIGLNSINEFKKVMEQNNISYDNIKKKIIIEILWNQLIVKKHFNEVKINEEDIRKNLSIKKIDRV